MKHLRYDMYNAPAEHPEQVMVGLGISYQHATPQSIGDQWWFWNCINIPIELPTYLTSLNIKPEDAIGLGLSENQAKMLEEEK